MRGFTLAELLLVLFLLGVLLGLPIALVDRADPGARGLATSLSSFIESSRDRARTTGQPVRLEQLPEDLEHSARFTRLVFRPVLEASFEPGLVRREGLMATGSALVGETSGRFGACLDLREGGGVTVSGRGGQPKLTEGFVLEFHFLNELGGEGNLLEWPGLCQVWVDRSAGLRARVEIQASQTPELATAPSISASTDLASLPNLVSPGRWHHVRLSALSGSIQLYFDGKLEATQPWEGTLRTPDSEPFLGDSRGRFQGLLDEFQVLARYRESGPELRDGVEVFVDTTFLEIDRDGFLDPIQHPDSVSVRIMELDSEVASFVVGRFTQEAVQ
ncbi:MAG: prepilin-type N-terminal cleavage/methylation domain-containing protein [Planctomycetota bacterium]|jgi:prepilin-type N-terminal cleavage/methylation domain-containing protein|nr:prepilin-type N-terminal cleavage/methylation domain-containing protein [Planctomycetota bacterium]MDP6941104.1 prepilin-type N-terminal cleavage/methylation domain-containing protein [Planctomycetota bacterium]